MRLAVTMTVRAGSSGASELMTIVPALGPSVAVSVSWITWRLVAPPASSVKLPDGAENGPVAASA